MSKARTKSTDVISAIFSLSQPLGHPDVLCGLLPVGTGSWRQCGTDSQILSWGEEEAWLLILVGCKKGTIPAQSVSAMDSQSVNEETMNCSGICLD